MNPVARAIPMPTTLSVRRATRLRGGGGVGVGVEVMRSPYADAVDEGVALERVIDLPPVIVWDALVDPVLVEGWLHPTARLLDGAVLERVEGELLRVQSDDWGAVDIALDELAGGTRGRSTR